jgi:hypothetical protein
MENLQSYLNKHAQLKPDQEGFPSSAAQQAANERILARRVEPGETVYGSNGKLIPAGWYAIVEVDEEGLTIIASDPAFFDLTWELDRPR